MMEESLTLSYICTRVCPRAGTTHSILLLSGALAAARDDGGELVL
jgi:hypothetical protein